MAGKNIKWHFNIDETNRNVYVMCDGKDLDTKVQENNTNNDEIQPFGHVVDVLPCKDVENAGKVLIKFSGKKSIRLKLQEFVAASVFSAQFTKYLSSPQEFSEYFKVSKEKFYANINEHESNLHVYDFENHETLSEKSPPRVIEEMQPTALQSEEIQQESSMDPWKKLEKKYIGTYSLSKDSLLEPTSEYRVRKTEDKDVMQIVRSLLHKGTLSSTTIPQLIVMVNPEEINKFDENNVSQFSYMVIDGNHRLKALKEAERSSGKVITSSLNCVIYKNLTVEEAMMLGCSSNRDAQLVKKMTDRDNCIIIRKQFVKNKTLEQDKSLNPQASEMKKVWEIFQVNEQEKKQRDKIYPLTCVAKLSERCWSLVCMFWDKRSSTAASAFNGLMNMSEDKQYEALSELQRHQDLKRFRIECSELKKKENAIQIQVDDKKMVIKQGQAVFVSEDIVLTIDGKSVKYKVEEFAALIKGEKEKTDNKTKNIIGKQCKNQTEIQNTCRSGIESIEEENVDEAEGNLLNERTKRNKSNKREGTKKKQQRKENFPGQPGNDKRKVDEVYDEGNAEKIINECDGTTKKQRRKENKSVEAGNGSMEDQHKNENNLGELGNGDSEVLEKAKGMTTAIKNFLANPVKNLPVLPRANDTNFMQTVLEADDPSKQLDEEQLDSLVSYLCLTFPELRDLGHSDISNLLYSTVCFIMKYDNFSKLNNESEMELAEETALKENDFTFERYPPNVSINDWIIITPTKTAPPEELSCPWIGKITAKKKNHVIIDWCLKIEKKWLSGVATPKSDKVLMTSIMARFSWKEENLIMPEKLESLIQDFWDS